MQAIIAALPKDYLYDEEPLNEEMFRGEVDMLDALKQKVNEKADYASLAEKQRKKIVKVREMAIEKAKETAGKKIRGREQLYGNRATTSQSRGPQPPKFNGRYFFKRYGHRKIHCEKYEIVIKKQGGRVKEGRKRYGPSFSFPPLRASSSNQTNTSEPNKNLTTHRQIYDLT